MERVRELLNTYRREVLIVAGIVAVVAIYMLFGGQRPSTVTSTTQPTKSLAHSSSAAHRPAGKVVVDVKGAVNKPGVYELKRGARIAEAVNRAGGFRSDADGNQVNLAKQVSDQQMLYIPMKGEQTNQAGSAGNSPGQEMEAKTVNLNTANKEQLTTVTGIGDKKADLILAYRQQHGQFERVEDLKNITGFGDKTIAKIKDQLAV